MFHFSCCSTPTLIWNSLFWIGDNRCNYMIEKSRRWNNFRLFLEHIPFSMLFYPEFKFSQKCSVHNRVFYPKLSTLSESPHKNHFRCRKCLSHVCNWPTVTFLDSKFLRPVTCPRFTEDSLTSLVHMRCRKLNLILHREMRDARDPKMHATGICSAESSQKPWIES